MLLFMPDCSLISFRFMELGESCKSLRMRNVFVSTPTGFAFPGRFIRLILQYETQNSHSKILPPERDILRFPYTGSARPQLGSDLTKQMVAAIRRVIVQRLTGLGHSFAL